jgi:16S rRNA (guanine527-N7)-methyltransferase
MPRKQPLQISAADRAKALELVSVSRETRDRLDAYVDLLVTWQRTTNLIAPSTEPMIWTRHIADSLQLLDLAPKSARVWVDIGSGAGLPGLVLACTLAPPAVVHLVESNAKKAAFLREAVRATAAPAQVHAQRIEDFTVSFQGDVDVVTARAVAPLKTLLGYAAPLVERGAQALFLKGQDVEAELTDAAKYWKIEADFVPSKTDAKARIVVIRRVSRTLDTDLGPVPRFRSS